MKFFPSDEERQGQFSAKKFASKTKKTNFNLRQTEILFNLMLYLFYKDSKQPRGY